MNYKAIIKRSWEFTQYYRGLKWYAAVPAFFSTLVGVCYFGYYAYLLWHKMENIQGGDINVGIARIWEFLSTHPTVLWGLLIFAGITLLFHFFLSIIFEGGLIRIINKLLHGEQVSLRKVIPEGIRVYVGLFEYHTMMSFFSFYVAGTLAVRFYYYLGASALRSLLIVIVVIQLIGFFISFMFIFTEYFIALEQMPLARALSRSTKMVVLNIEETFLMLLFVALIAVRIVINLVLVLLIPALIVLLMSWLASSLLNIAGVVIGAIVGLAMIVFISYLNGVISIFVKTLWIFVYQDLYAKDNYSE